MQSVRIQSTMLPPVAAPDVPYRRSLGDWDFDGKRILGHIGYDIYLWDANTGRLLNKFVGHHENIKSVQFSPDGKYALTGSEINGGPLCSYQLPQFRSKDTSVRLWNLDNGEEIWKLDGQVAPHFSPDGKRVVTLSLPNAESCKGTPTAAIWDVYSGRKLLTINTGKTIWMAALSQNNSVLLREVDRGAVLYDARSGKQQGRIDRVDAFNFYGSHGYLAISTSRGIDILNSTDGQIIQHIPFSGEIHWNEATLWTNDGKQIVELTSQSSHTAQGCQIEIWNADSGEIANRFNCPPDAIYFRSFLISPDNRFLLISWGGTNVENRFIPAELGVFDLSTGSRLAGVMKSQTPVAFSSNSKTFLVLDNMTQPAIHFTVYSSDSGNIISSSTLRLER
jgi:WD40 repeat protein